MKLRAIRLHNVRRFAGKGIAIDAIEDGVNVLAESNEYGKSTVFDAVHALFFQSHKGTGKAVRSLQPYSKGAVTVEAEIETGEGRFRLRKRWYGSAQAVVAEVATGRLIAQADEADRWIDARMRGGGAGPAGLLWVQQGVVEMGQGSGKSGEAEKAAREDVLSSVSGEIETLTGGRRTTQVLAKCRADLDALVTATGKAKAGGPYAAARDERDALLARQDDLSARVAELRDDLDRRAKARRRLSELQEEGALDRESRALAEAEQALAHAEGQAEKLARAELAEKLAAQEQKAAADALAAFDASLAAIADLKTRIASEQEQRDAAAQARGKAVADMEGAAGALTKARAALGEAEAALAAANAAIHARAAAARLTELRQTLEQATAANRAAEDDRARAAALNLPDAEVARLEKIEEKLASLTAARRAASASLRITYESPSAPRICQGGSELPDDQPVAIDRPTVFEVTGIGTLTVSPGSGTVGDSDQHLRKAQEQRVGLLAALGIESLEAARTRQQGAAESRRKAELQETKRDTLAPKGLDVLRAECARLEAQAEVAPEATEPVEALTDRHRLTADMRDRAEAAQTAAQSSLNEWERVLVQRDTDLARSREALGREELGLGDGTARDTLAASKAETEAAYTRAHGAAAVLREAVPDLASLRAAKARAESVLTRIREETGTLGRTISELDGRIGTRAHEGIEEDLAETEGRLTRAEARLVEIEAEVATLQRLHTVLTDARAEAKEHFFGPVMQELKPLLQLVFGDAVVAFDETTLLPVSLERGGAVEKFDVLSGGMREQITILTRLAFARLLAEDGRTVPVILDDALIYSDDDRIERMFDALHRQALDLQILVFTCRQRAFRALGGREMQVSAWVPEEGV